MTDVKRKAFKPMMYATPKDEDPTKAFPNGLRVLFAALWQRWAIVAHDLPGTTTSAESFAKATNLRVIGKKLKKRYPASPKPPAMSENGRPDAKAAAEFLHLGGARIKDSMSIKLDYMSLRRAAEVVGLPVGLLVMYTNLISQERRAEKELQEATISSKKTELLKLVEKIELFGREARTIIEECDENEEIFYESFGPGEWDYPKADASGPLPGEEAYLANLTVLKRLRDACKIGHGEDLTS
mgnify:CR=1 FL=1